MKYFLAVFLIGALLAAPVFAQETDQAEDVHKLVRVELVSDRDAVVAGEAFRLGVHFVLEEGWHVYWTNPGDAGIPTTVQWTAPEGFTVGATQYPAPIYFGAGTALAGYGYEHEVLLFAEAAAPENLSGADATFTAVADWLVCKHKCIPGKKEVTLTVPVAETAAPSASVAMFDAARAKVPVPVDAQTDVRITGLLDADGILPNADFEAMFVVRAEGAKISPLTDPVRPLLIPMKSEDYELTDVTAASGGTPEELAARVKAHAFPGEAPEERIGGVFQFTLDKNGATREVIVSYGLPVPRVAEGAAVAKIELPPMAIAAPKAAATAPPASLPLMLLFAFVGGIILNIMPCVLPVVSIKLLSLVKQSDLSPVLIRRHGLAYTAGILVSFLSLATGVAVLKAGGEAIGWGFQFQSPYFVAALAAIVFGFGLSLLGVFEFVTPASRTMATASQAAGLGGSFSSGVFATVLATPCTAPFLGAAVGFAFSQPTPVTFAVFSSVALGLAFPFLLLAYLPAWTRFMPKPGDWMETFKALMGFLLIATTVWLMDVLGKQVGAEGITRMLAYLAVIGLATWIFGRFGNIMRDTGMRRAALTATLLLIVAGAWGLLRFEGLTAQSAAAVTDEGGVRWEKFSEKKVAELSSQGKTVFIDFTAAWCWTCKVNEKAVLGSSDVIAALRADGVAPLKGDWTNRDPEITDFLTRHGKAGVPLYVVVPPGKPDAPILLPEVITPQIVLDALKQARG